MRGLEEQIIDDTHDAFLVDTGGELGSLLITVELGEQIKDDFGGFPASFFVWNPTMMEKPVQIFTDVVSENAFGYHNVVDANFNGFQDFGYMWLLGNQPNYWYYWLWNEEQGSFINCEALSGISAPQFNSEKQVITGWQRDSAASGVQTYYRWINKDLVLIRMIEFHYPEDWRKQLVTVEDIIDGQMVEVYRKENDLSEAKENEPRIDEKWFAVDYHGE